MRECSGRRAGFAGTATAAALKALAWLAAALCAAAASAAEDGGRPANVLIIGDSISIYYTPFVKELLAGKAVVKHSGHAASTREGLQNIDRFLGDTKWDVIHFNWGLHDLKASGTNVPVKDYEKNLRELVARLRKTGAKLVWATITPAGSANPRDDRRTSDIDLYNATALRVMKEEGVLVDDLYAAINPRRSELQNDDHVHFSEAGSRLLAASVARSVLSALGLADGEKAPAGAKARDK